ncbi:MAG: hypothetical protein AAF702_31595 [Chloroflexota bacterium]
MFPLIALIIVFLTILGYRWRAGRRQREQRTIRGQQFRSWVIGHRSMDSRLQQWILGLSPIEREILLDLLDGYCNSLNWRLNWLFTPAIKKAPRLHGVVDENVRAYAEMILVSLQMEIDVHAYQTYLDFEQRPTARTQRTMVHQLYSKIEKSKLMPARGRLLGRFSRNDATLSRQIATIKYTFEHSPAQAMDMLIGTIVGEDSGLAPSETYELGPPVLTRIANVET